MSLIPPPVSHTLIDTVAWGIPITNTVNVAIVPINHNALSVNADTNCEIAPALGGGVPVTPAARNASACANTNAA